MAEQETLKKVTKLRFNEYYNMQPIFDKLHEKACNNHIFTNLMSIITSENNMLLAYRNIKKNKGSNTKGTDGYTIKDFKGWTEKNYINNFQRIFNNYKPKSVRRVEIPKEGQPDKTRPLGIPCMTDRIVQQSILQVLDPICEAKFHKHSYGFRPLRSTEHAIARANYLMFNIKLHYVIDIDIKSFFDEINHGKLLKQMWNLGIRDKTLLSIIGRILKSEIQGLGLPEKGSPQGGIISPLLSNITLNELDWWLSNQWETFKSNTKYSRKSGQNQALKKSKLKEFYFVRYADDFKIFCRDYKTAKKIFIATKLWLKDRLGLAINPKKSKITNLKKARTSFLGIELYVKLGKKKKYITRSNISKKAIKTMKLKLKEQVIAIQRKNGTNRQAEVMKLNSMILGLHNYYKMATLCNLDFKSVNFILNKNLYNRFKGQTKKGKRKNKDDDVKNMLNAKTYQKLYGKHKHDKIIISNIGTYPLHGVQYKIPEMFKPQINKYTEKGRTLVHDNLINTDWLIKYLLQRKLWDRSIEYNDNCISLMAGQQGKCFITKEILEPWNMHCHHKIPIKLGGTDAYDNLVWLNGDVHILIHATSSDTISIYLHKLNLDKNALKKVNSLRLLAGNLEIVQE